MNRFAFTSIALATFALAACGDDSTGTGGGGGATSASTGDSPTSSPSSSSASGNPSSSSANNSSSAGNGGDPGTGGAPGTGGDDTGSGGGTGGTGAGTGGSSGECAPECATDPEELEGISAECQGCAEDHVGAGDCQSEFLACAGASAGPNDAPDCNTCSDLATTGSLEGLCESNLDEAEAVLACICTVCG